MRIFKTDTVYFEECDTKDPELVHIVQSLHDIPVTISARTKQLLQICAPGPIIITDGATKTKWYIPNNEALQLWMTENHISVLQVKPVIKAGFPPAVSAEMLQDYLGEDAIIEIIGDATNSIFHKLLPTEVVVYEHKTTLLKQNGPFNIKELQKIVPIRKKKVQSFNSEKNTGNVIVTSNERMVGEYEVKHIGSRTVPERIAHNMYETVWNILRENKIPEFAFSSKHYMVIAAIEVCSTLIQQGSIQIHL